MKTLRFKGFLSAALTAALAVTLISGASAAAAGPSAAASGSSDGKVRKAGSYSEVYAALQAVSSAGYSQGGVLYSGAGSAKSASAAPANAAAGDSSASAAPTPGAGASGDYSQTNVQIPGVDESDIVKNDGSCIYVLHNNKLIIFKADGASTKELSSVSVGTQPDASGAESNRYANEYASDLYISGKTAVVISSYYSYAPYVPTPNVNSSAASSSSAAKIAVIGRNKQIAKITLYDVSNPSAPSLKATLGQDGYLVTSRLIGDTLYLVSNYFVYNIQQNSYGTFVPSVYRNSDASCLPADSIAIMPVVSSSSYSVICAYSVSSGTVASSQSVLGGGSTVYMDKNTLYLAGTRDVQTSGTPYTHTVYKVVDNTSKNVTDLVSYDVSNGGLNLKANGTIDGALYSQFALDAYNGNLRVVTSQSNQSWSVYTDDDLGFVNYKWNTTVNSNALYVLDGSLSVIGSIKDLAPGEQVYSVRFDGATGYITTFRQVDPLFAVDLSDPANPQVLSALKIPGFSEYLHVYDTGRLFGLGMNADAATGRTDGMKLVMFDTTDPKAVTVKHEMTLDAGYSTALYNHKAILISKDKNLIAFPTDKGYDIYGYSDQNGFFKRASIGSMNWSGDDRGLYIDSYAYIVGSDAVTVLNLDDLLLAGRVSY